MLIFNKVTAGVFKPKHLHDGFIELVSVTLIKKGRRDPHLCCLHIFFGSWNCKLVTNLAKPACRILRNKHFSVIYRNSESVIPLLVEIETVVLSLFPGQ